MKNETIASYKWRDHYLTLPNKINGHWRWFETVERRRVLRPHTRQAKVLSYEWEYKIKEHNKVPGWDRPFESGVDD